MLKIFLKKLVDITVRILKKSFVKLVNGLKLLLQLIKTEYSLYISIILIVIMCVPLTSLNQDIQTNIIASLIFTIPILFLQLVSKYQKFSRLEGIYDSYLYDKKDMEKLMTDIPIGVYEVQYEGGYQISIKKKQSLEVGHESYIWGGKAEIPDVEIGTLYWRYTSPPEYKNFVGYKRIVVSEERNENIKIFMFGEEGIVNLREVLIKRSE